MAFETFDLGNVLQTAEAIKGARRQSNIDRLREQYLGGQVAQQQQEQQATLDSTRAKQVISKSASILSSQSPSQYIQQAEPDLLPHLQQMGVDVNDDNQVKQAVTILRDHAYQSIGEAPPVQMQTKGDLNHPENGIYQVNPSNNEIRQVTPPQKESSLQHTDAGLIFNPSAGTYSDSSGKILSSDEVASREARAAASRSAQTTAATQKAKLDSLPKGSMDAMVESYMQTGQVPSGLARSPAQSASFWGAVSDRAARDGNSVASQMAQTRMRGALKPAMEQTQKQLAANQSFLATLDKNIASADGLAQRVGGDNSPALNTLFNKWKRGVTGDPDVAAFDAFNNSIVGEAAKIASGGVGSVGATSDGQIEHQRQIMNSAQNYKQWRSAANALMAEGHNRINSIIEQRSSLLQQSDTSSQTNPTNPPPQSPANPATQPPDQSLQPGQTYKHSSGAVITILQ